MKKRRPGVTRILAFICVTFFITGLTAMPVSGEDEFDFIEPAQSIVTPNTLDHTGAAITRIPIQVPPGRKGIQPDLTLVYNSYAKNGWVGVGWDLSMGVIQRATKRGVDYSNNDYVAVTNGATHELVQRIQWGADYYGARIEKNFSKYYLRPDGNGWIVTCKDGTRYYFGETENARQQNEHGVFKWYLSRIIDPNGNFLTVSYHHIDGRLYLSQTVYTGHEATGIRGSHWVDFILEDRPDISLNFSSHAQAKTTRRLDKIVVYSNNQLFRIYDLTYDTSPASGRSRLTAVKLIGSDGIKSLPPHKMIYEEGTAAAFDDYDIFKISSIPAGQIAATTIHLAEANGDGLTDVIFKSGRNLYYKYSNGDGSFGEGYGDTFIPGTFLGFADVNGDGLADMIARMDDKLYVRLATGKNTYDDIVNTGLRSVISDNARPYFSDVNGDGYTDIIFKVNSRLYPLQSNGDGTFMAINEIPRVTGEYLGFADVTGDGLTDYVGLYAYRWLWVYPGKGDGSFGSVISTEIPAGEYTQTARPYFADINGDGLTDVVLKHFSTLFVKLSNGDGTFRHTQINCGVSGDIFGFADMTGDGFADVIRVTISEQYSSANSIKINFTGNARPIDLMTSYTSSAGAVTTLGYMQSTIFEDMQVPFVLYPVTEITIDGGLGNASTTSITYKSGRFYHQNRAFHGFSVVTQTRPDSSVETTWYYVSNPEDLWYWKGKPSQIELRDPTGKLLSRQRFAWTDDTVSIGSNESIFVNLSVKIDDHFDDPSDKPSATAQQTYTYDPSNGNLALVSHTGSVGDPVETEYTHINKGDWLWRRSQEALKDNNNQIVRQTLYDYDSRGNLTSETYYLEGNPNPVVTRSYDAYGNVWKVHDANGNPPTITEYDPIMHTLVTKVTNPLGHATYYQYDYQYCKVAETIDANSNGTGYEYDPFGRLIEVNFPDGGRTLFEYSDCSDDACRESLKPRYVLTRVKENNPGSYVDKYEYIDGLNRKVQVTTRGEGNKYIVTKFLYDLMGRQYRTEGPFFSTASEYPVITPANSTYTETGFDYRGRPNKIESPLGEDTDFSGHAVNTMSYSGFDTTATDPDGSTKTEQRDHLGRIVRVIEHADSDDIKTQYKYNAAGDLTRVTNHLGHKTLIDYDTLGRKISMDDLDMGLWQYTYDANGNLKTQTDAKSQTIAFDYDALNRLTKKSYSTSDPEVTYAYDSTSVSNGIGRLHKMSNANATKIINSYDAMGRELKATKTIVGAGKSYTTEYTYDLSGKPAGIIYPDGHVVNQSYYPGTGLLHTVEGSNPGREYAVLESYTTTGNIGGIYHGNQTDTRFTYDPLSTRLLAIKTVDQEMTELQHRSYKYSAAGDIVGINDVMRKAGYNYSYDKLHRLISETSTGATESFKPVALTSNYSSAPVHAATSMNVNWESMRFEYDANGNMTLGWDLADPDQIAKRLITYNADNMPVRIEYTKGETTTVVNLSYDGEGKRVKKEVAGGKATYYINEHFEVAGGNQIKYVFAGNLRIAKVESGVPVFFHKDHLGSSTVMTDYNNGVALETSDYLPFGLTRNQTGEKVTYYKFTDQELDVNIGLHNYNARLYDPGIAVFISPDSIIPQWYDPNSHNRYSYCINNPLIYTDPDGHWITTAIGAISGAISGSTVGIQDGNIGSAIFGGVVGGVAGAIAGSFTGTVGGTVGGRVVAQLAIQGLKGIISGGIGGFFGGGSSQLIKDGDPDSSKADQFIKGAIPGLKSGMKTGFVAGISGGAADAAIGPALATQTLGKAASGSYSAIMGITYDLINEVLDSIGKNTEDVAEEEKGKIQGDYTFEISEDDGWW